MKRRFSRTPLIDFDLSGDLEIMEFVCNWFSLVGDPGWVFFLKQIHEDLQFDNHSYNLVSVSRMIYGFFLDLSS